MSLLLSSGSSVRHPRIRISFGRIPASKTPWLQPGMAQTGSSSTHQEAGRFLNSADSRSSQNTPEDNKPCDPAPSYDCGQTIFSAWLPTAENHFLFPGGVPQPVPSQRKQARAQAGFVLPKRFLFSFRGQGNALLLLLYVGITG